MRSVLIFAFFCFTFFAAGIYFTSENKLVGRTAVIKKSDQGPAKPALQKAPRDKTEPSINEEEKTPKNNLNNLSCANYDRRSFAVIIAEDKEARPLSSINAADLVIEIPVVTGSITRMMALFVCEDPKEIGSVRSARHDFTYLALGYDAILAHWGGSHFALEELDKGIIDNLDAMVNYYDSFYRKKWIPAPHNGFTSMERMLNASKKLEYRLKSEFEGYKFVEDQEPLIRSDRSVGTTARLSEALEIEGGEGQAPLRSDEATEGQAKIENQKERAKSKTLKIGYKYPYNVEYRYNIETDSYLRWRGGEKEIDALTNKPVEVKNIAVMRARSRQIGGGYNDVDVTGSGEAAVYRSGEEIKGTWNKKSEIDVLRFFDESKDEIKFITGKIWINIVEIDTLVSYFYTENP